MNIILVLVIALLVAERNVEADFSYNRVLPKNEDLKSLGLKCIPGRTVIRVEEKKVIPTSESEEDDDEEDTRRTHMNADNEFETCQVCVCSVEGKDEYCSRRPARNVNECIRMSMIKDEFERHLPFSHERSLAFRIRRDYIWHDDEIPYESKARCRRGRSYYSNSVTANDTDIDVASDIDSLLDYSNKDICFYCVCSVDGKSAGCLSRDPVFCEYYRIIRYPDAARDRYRQLFQQDRPAYFRQLSYRLRRMMDDGMFELMENVGSDLADAKCIPYVSEYSDCSAANVCTGCKRCSCDAEGNWACRRVIECPQVDENEAVDDLMLENALNNLYSGMEIKKTKRVPGALVPEPAKPEDDLLLVPEIKFDVEGELKSLFTRQKRSSDDERDNGTVKFYETVDDMNEDTLKSSNISGTLKANKINTEATSSRRAGVLGRNNASNLTSLHIKYNEPHEFEHHVAENKVDSKHPLEDKINGLSHEEIHRILGNYSQSIKNNDLSKLVVNEMIRGSEIIGDKNVQPLSNITFTPENDTITAMAFIAGNLLNKLWDMEKDTGEESFETEELKHKKINDLLGLFKEPLSIRQENFLKNALEKLSQVIDSKQDVKNVTLCTNFEETDITKPKQSNCTEKSIHNHQPKAALGHKNKSNLDKEKRAESDAVKRINDVLHLIKKYEHIQNSLGNLKNVQIESNIKQPSVIKEKALSSDENISLNLYGNILSKITNLLSPEKKFKKIIKKINSYHMLRQDEKPKKDLENVFGFDLGNLTMSSKDKLITDYLKNIEKHPNCFFSNLQQPVLSELPNIEGNILYNLSEFFKIKSFTDLLNLVKNKSDNVNIQSTTTSATTNNSTFMTQSTINTNEKYLKTSLKSKPIKLLSVKEKLKNDLKTILQDLVELQSEHGLKPKSKINIADALPCIYNILNTDVNMKNKASVNSIEKIKSFMDALKAEMKFTFLSRRSNVVITQRPKSAVVWERAIKNLNKNKPATRRYLGQDKKTYKELKDMMENVELSSHLYKNIAIQRGVAPSERLVLLKTLQADINQYTEVLKNINKSLETVINLPIEKQNEFNEFVDNAAININLNRKVVEVTEKTKGNMVENITPRVLLPTNAMYSIENKQSLVMPNWMDSNENHFKLRRDEIINQLIMNRLKLYIKKKENSGVDFNADINYNLAKRILYNLEIGNIALAKELFKVFMANEKPKHNYDQQNLKEYKNPVVDKRMESRGPSLLAFREPLVKVEDPKRLKMLSPDHFWKQLWNLENIKEQ